LSYHLSQEDNYGLQRQLKMKNAWHDLLVVSGEGPFGPGRRPRFGVNSKRYFRFTSF
jgi:hypothetical protein